MGVEDHGNWSIDSVAISGTGSDVCTPITSDMTWFFWKPKKEENMRGLFRITVVDPKLEVIYDPVLVIAKDREAALLRAEMPSGVRVNPDDFDIIVERVGDVRAKKDVQKVRVIGEGE